MLSPKGSNLQCSTSAIFLLPFRYVSTIPHFHAPCLDLQSADLQHGSLHMEYGGAKECHVQHCHGARCQVFPQVLFLLHHERGRKLQWICEIVASTNRHYFIIYVFLHLSHRYHRRCLSIHFLEINPKLHTPYWHNAPYLQV